ncbi:MAG: hypothetical protein WCT32_02705 [Patescibacteria group bacterium]|jgi:hypothetical protein
MEHKVLVSITSFEQKDWKSQIRDIAQLKIRELSLFLTSIKLDERQEYYRALEKVGGISIPFVHARQDMAPDEYHYLIKRFGTKLFNLHSNSEYPLEYDLGELRSIIALENTSTELGLPENELGSYAGLCLDFAHLESDRLAKSGNYAKTIPLLDRYPILVNHVSAIGTKPEINQQGMVCYDAHHMDDMEQLNYLQQFPLRYFAPIIAIELTNTIKEQLEIKTYIENLIVQKLASLATTQ